MTELQRVTQIAGDLIALHLDPTQWAFAFDNAKKRAGCCDYTRKKITVSRYIAAQASEADIRQVVLHEIAHALAGPAAGHGQRWLSVARLIGYTGQRTHNVPIATEIAPWQGCCPAGHEHVRFRKPTGMYSCGKCERRFNRSNLIHWEHRKVTPGMRKLAAQRALATQRGNGLPEG